MKKILVVIDMQNDFIDGALGTAEAVSIVPAVLDKIRGYAPECIYATRDTHHENYLETLEGQKLPVRHCIEGTQGWQLQETIQEALGNAMIFDKPTFGSFELVRRLTEEHENGPIAIEIVGLCTDICVASNALLLRAALPDTPIAVDAKCCAGVTPETHTAALATMRMCQIDIQ